MFKYLLLATLFITFSNADTMYNGKCVKEFYTLDKPGLCNRKSA